mgnify:CR=1 FL=1
METCCDAAACCAGAAVAAGTSVGTGVGYAVGAAVGAGVAVGSAVGTGVGSGVGAGVEVGAASLPVSGVTSTSTLLSGVSRVVGCCAAHPHRAATIRVKINIDFFI